MEDDHAKQEAAQLMEDAWFFDNPLKKKENTVCSNSYPSPSSKIDEISDAQKKKDDKGKMKSVEEDDDDDYDDGFGPRMGDLIRQAMPSKLPKAHSLPVDRAKREVSSHPMSKLSRVSSLDNSSKPTHKGMKQISSVPNISRRARNEPKSKNIHKSMSLKTLSDIEVQGFQDLGFTFRDEDLCPAVVAKLARANLKEETEQGEVGKKGKMNASSAAQAQWPHSPPITKWIDAKSSDKEMKEKIKSWSKSVALNIQHR